MEHYAQLLGALGEATALYIREAKALSTQLLAKRSVLFLQIVDHVLLGSIHPASQKQRESLKRETDHRPKFR
ncbi:MAG: hypothetical protein IPK00_21070 [Deltaproteobacteria bacterium]|nr:hypothetical protein [Deltaproteobacteria bacterium]